MATQEAYFVSRSELLGWINSTLDLRISKVEEVKAARSSITLDTMFCTLMLLHHQDGQYHVGHHMQGLVPLDVYADCQWSRRLSVDGRVIPWHCTNEEGEVLLAHCIEPATAGRRPGS